MYSDTSKGSDEFETTGSFFITQCLSSDPAPWFCSESCSLAADGEDYLLNYTRAVLWEGLYHMARRDAIQEGDGEAITDFWRMDLVLLWTREHLQLFNSGHQLLTGTNQNRTGRCCRTRFTESSAGSV